MRNNSLVPTQIVNRNGVLTTVHKSPQRAAAPQSLMTAPMLQSMPNPEDDETIERLAGSFRSGLWGVPDGIKRPEIERKFKALPDETKTFIRDALDRHRRETYIERMVVSMLHKDRSPETIRDVLHVYQHTNDWSSLVMNTSWTEDGFDVDYGIISKLDSMHHYNSRLKGFSFRADGADTPLLVHDERTQKQVIALIDITGYFAESDTFSLDDTLVLIDEDNIEVLKDTALAQLIVDRAGDYAEIMATMQAIHNDRGSLDSELIRTTLTTEAQPLRDGHL